MATGQLAISSPGAQPVPNVLPNNSGMAMPGQSVPLSQLSDLSAAYRPQAKASSADGVVASTQTATPAATVITSTEEMPAPKRRWWWPVGGSNK
jgi:hypothetical protein